MVTEQQLLGSAGRNGCGEPFAISDERQGLGVIPHLCFLLDWPLTLAYSRSYIAPFTTIFGKWLAMAQRAGQLEFVASQDARRCGSHIEGTRLFASVRVPEI